MFIGSWIGGPLDTGVEMVGTDGWAAGGGGASNSGPLWVVACEPLLETFGLEVWKGGGCRGEEVDGGLAWELRAHSNSRLAGEPDPAVLKCAGLCGCGAVTAAPMFMSGAAETGKSPTSVGLKKNDVCRRSAEVYEARGPG